jgi:hypothetical protein
MYYIECNTKTSEKEAPHMADYPDWVTVHKKKGTYINVVGGKYYLYAAHSERIKGTKKVRRVSDGYLGRITEEEGFIPAKGKMDDGIRVYEFGLSETIVRLCPKIHAGLRREFRANADYVMTSGILTVMHGSARREFYEASWLSERFPGLDPEKPATDKQQTGIERASRMIKDTLTRHFGDGLETAFALLPLVRKARIGKETRLADTGESIILFAAKYGIDFNEEV